jgi:c(7)-type cytochrome triheme protein
MTTRERPVPRGRRTALLAMAVATALGGFSADAPAEYGDVVLNKRSEAAGVRPVVFSHWFHRIRFRCKVCHSELGFVMRAGANDVLMADIANGKLCGMCHNGQVAWGAEQCDLCHSGKRGLKSGIHGSHETRGPGKW